MMRRSRNTAGTASRAGRAALTALAIAVSVSGCSSFLPSNNRSTADAVSGSARQYHQLIDVSGRLSVRYEQDGKEQAIHGNFTWSQNNQDTVVTLLSPLGQTLATINIGVDKATLAQAGQPLRSAGDVDSLTVQTLGWPLPIAGLRDWLQGFGSNAAGQRFVATPATDTYDVTTADNWRLQYANWQNQENAAESYPKRIDLARNTKQAGDVAIRIVIDSRQPR
ncbi:lipoprotein insertase outer membrane protein LolB [Collimonas sp.]|jgi:outer membrane lipoprotein LolB|uniref:lipoprotein insertase outer membrane protein LolB n=1 Tax=Collimonas sp. TaxID=1963772 RepID=UPI0037C02409